MEALLGAIVVCIICPPIGGILLIVCGIHAIMSMFTE